MKSKSRLPSRSTDLVWVMDDDVQQILVPPYPGGTMLQRRCVRVRHTPTSFVRVANHPCTMYIAFFLYFGLYSYLRKDAKGSTAQCLLYTSDLLQRVAIPYSTMKQSRPHSAVGGRNTSELRTPSCVLHLPFHTSTALLLP